MRDVIKECRRKGRKFLTEVETYILLEEVGIPAANHVLCQSSQQAGEEAPKIGYPLVMKVVSPDILHKTDAGCVELGITNHKQLIKAWDKILKNAKSNKRDAEIHGILLQKMVDKGNEVIVGIKKDPQFGYVVLFGLGGIFVELLEDVSLRLVPIDKLEAVEMIRETKGFKVLQGIRGKNPSDIDALARVLVALSRIVLKHPEIEELDINPLFVYEKGKGVLAADGLIVLS